MLVNSKETSLELLISVATGPGSVLELARKLIGEERLALIYAKLLASEFGETLSPTTVARVFGMSRTGAEGLINKCAARSARK